MDDTKAAVTMPVEELAKLLRHTDNSFLVFNLPRGPGNFHRCLRLQLLESVPGKEEIRFELQEDMRIAQVATHSVVALFTLLPNLARFLEVQAHE